MTDIVERLRNTEFAFEPPLKAIDLMEEAADEIERLRAALGNISRMKVFPDAAINQTTLAAAIHIARAALGEKA